MLAPASTILSISTILRRNSKIFKKHMLVAADERPIKKCLNSSVKRMGFQASKHKESQRNVAHDGTSSS